jgi:hypothetical protein
MLQQLSDVDSLMLVQVIATAMMTGIIWFVQIVHYPLFQMVPMEYFVPYERSHTARTGWVVAPLMLLELTTALLPIILSLPVAHNKLYGISFALLLLIWLSTFLIQVPLHAILENHPNPTILKHLVTTNWIRTILWTARLGMLIALILAGKSC